MNVLKILLHDKCVRNERETTNRNNRGNLRRAERGMFDCNCPSVPTEKKKINKKIKKTYFCRMKTVHVEKEMAREADNL